MISPKQQQQQQQQRTQRSDCCTVRISKYQLIWILLGCAGISFQTGWMIARMIRHNRYHRYHHHHHQNYHPDHHPNLMIQHKHAQSQQEEQQYKCMNSNMTLQSTTRITSIMHTQTPRTDRMGMCTPSSCLNLPIRTYYNNLDQFCPMNSDDTDDENDYKVQRQYHHSRGMTLLQPELHRSRSHRRYTTATATTTIDTEYYEAMVHPSLLIHPHPHRVIIIYDDESGQILTQVLQHKSILQIIYILPEAAASRILHQDDSRITLVYSNDPILFLQQSSSFTNTATQRTAASLIATVDAIFVDYRT